MQDRFGAYYRPGDDELDDLWSEALVVPDANVLLHLYSYTEPTRGAFLDVFGAVEDRLWLPDQVGHEFHRHRPDRKREVVETYDDYADAVADARDGLQQARQRLEDLLEDLADPREHPVVDDPVVDKARQALGDPLPELVPAIEAAREDQTIVVGDPVAPDALTDRLGSLLDGRIGDGFDDEELAAIYEEGERRFEENLPPGYEDASKDEDRRRYGDLVIWRSMVRRAAEEGRPVVFVTADVKEDWWWQSDHDRVAPRAELRDEMRDEAGTDFYAYTPEEFLQVADERLDVDVEEAALEEIRRKEARYRRIGDLLSEKHDLYDRRDRIDDQRRRIEATLGSLADEVEAVEAALEAAQPASDRWAKLRAELDELQARRDELRSELDDAERRRGEVDARLDDVHDALDDLFNP